MNFEIITRPVRVGWCVRSDSADDFRRAVHLSHMVWGGRFNPIISVDDRALASQLVELFAVDALYPIAKEESVVSFCESFAHLPWPFFEDDLLQVDDNGQVRPLLLDVSHPLFLLQARMRDSPLTQRVLPVVEATDELRDVLVATFGGYPQDTAGQEYQRGFLEVLQGISFQITSTAPIAWLLESITPSSVAAFGLEPDRSHSWQTPGVYVGSSGNVADLIAYWNLRASGINLVFYDPEHESRLGAVVEAQVKQLLSTFDRRSEWDRRIAVWRREGSLADLVPGEFPASNCTVSESIWNGLNVQPPIMQVSRDMALGVESRSPERLSVSMALPSRPWLRSGRRASRQHVVFNYRPFVGGRWDEVFTFHPFNVPELNEYYGRECVFRWNTARLTRMGLGVIEEVTTSHESLYALDPRALIDRLFAVFGIMSAASQAGLIAQRLIRQMGGVQGCRVFKIRGVRALIESYSPLTSFTRARALQLIGNIDPLTNQPRFEEYEDLHIQKREKPKLTPDEVFTYLLSRRVFRVGLDLKCPNCNLEFWLALDDVKSITDCQYCGEQFDVAPLLRDRDWRYRRSGLFGRDDHQQGAIPVALTLQQLQTTLRYDASMYATSLNVSPASANIEACEVDFVLVGQDHDGRVHIAVGECKSTDEITEDDVQHLGQIADALSGRRTDGFVVFSKTGEFSPVEIERCKRAQSRYSYRVILLGSRELEPYDVYQHVRAKEQHRLYGGTLPAMAEATQATYFDQGGPPAT